MRFKTNRNWFVRAYAFDRLWQVKVQDKKNTYHPWLTKEKSTKKPFPPWRKLIKINGMFFRRGGRKKN